MTLSILSKFPAGFPKLLFAVVSQANLTTTNSTKKALVRLRRDAKGAKLGLKGEPTMLVLYRPKQKKTVEDLQKAKRAGYGSGAAKQQKQGVPSSTRSRPLWIVDIKCWRFRMGQEEDPERAPHLGALEQGEHTLRKKFERSLAEQVMRDVM